MRERRKEIRGVSDVEFIFFGGIFVEIWYCVGIWGVRRKFER